MQKLYVAMALCLVLLLTACSSKEASTMAFESDSSEVTNESRQDLLDNSNIAVTVASGEISRKLSWEHSTLFDFRNNSDRKRCIYMGL